ncbi:MAG: transcriptional repressor NrdR [Nitrospinae bacterium]|nr:transcriptional repressor NrdR [Nitrospinota bacterium]
MKGPFCGNTENKVVDSRVSKEGDIIRRRRECDKCGDRFTTHERIEEMLPLIIKKDGRREEFDREKIRKGLDKAFEKRQVSVEQKEAIIDRVTKRLRDLGEKEIKSAIIGQAIMDELKNTDEVAYVRFASVYRSFRDVNEFMAELNKLLGEKK